MANRFLRQQDENLSYLDEEEMDAIRALLTYILMKNTQMNKDDIYTYIFGEGKKILWN